MRIVTKRLFLAASAAALCSLRVGAAEGGVALDRFVPAEAGSAWLQADSLTFGDARLREKRPEDTADTLVLRLGGSHAADPLLVEYASGTTAKRVVSAQTTGALGASMTFGDDVRLGVLMPLQLHAAGERAIDRGYAYAPPASGVAPGDARLGLHWLFARGERIRAAVGAQGYVPTGARAAYAGEGAARVEPQLLLAGEGGAFAWATQAGVRMRLGEPAFFGDVPLRRAVSVAVACGWRSPGGEWLVGPEVRGSVSLDGNLAGGRSWGLVPILGVHYMFTDGWRVHAGVGSGVGTAVGTPLWNASLALEWAPFGGQEEPPPPPPSAPPPPPPAPPPPLDSDGDGIVDAEDACPAVAGAASATRLLHGCPPMVMVAVKFKVSSDVFLESSLPELERLRQELERFPREVRFRVEGHTDTSGDPRENLDLSQMRAGAVVRWLVAHDLDLPRFDAVGMGSSKPRVANDTPENRAQNRRVEVHVIAPASIVTP